MRTGYTSCLSLAIFLIIPTISASLFSIQDTYIGQDFFDKWDFETADDPTHGRTNYVDEETAKRTNLSYATDHKFVMQPDSTNVVQPGSRGRDSIRIMSQASYADSVIILDLQHMPWGCATWPAFWTLSASGPWPQGGEIDIIEGVNKNEQNLASLHTSPDCSMPQSRVQTGEVTSTNCDTSVNSNEGCGTDFNKPASYGDEFNGSEGGYYALARTKEDGIKVWYWSRYDPSTPLEVRTNFPVVDPDLWGIPEAYFPTKPDTCDYETHFDAHNLIFDLTFCGDWAGSVWSSAGCGSGTCADYVDNNPQAFEDAYWEVNSLRVYTPSGW